ncbi:hypothetical protein SNE40_017847 [Patella caerulea]|uniref:L-Fucosyltransferase n=1 Tax=Patella caerulea TaxID=87958 RepID=A0AAN8JF69_PATCE
MAIKIKLWKILITFVLIWFVSKHQQIFLQFLFHLLSVNKTIQNPQFYQLEQLYIVDDNDRIRRLGQSWNRAQTVGQYRNSARNVGRSWNRAITSDMKLNLNEGLYVHLKSKFPNPSVRPEVGLNSMNEKDDKNRTEIFSEIPNLEKSVKINCNIDKNKVLAVGLLSHNSTEYFKSYESLKTGDKLLTVIFSGDFGDVLFAYASLLGIALQYSRLPIIPRECFLSSIFKVTFTGIFQSKSWKNIDEETVNRLDRHKASIPNKHLKLRGKFRSFKYFGNISDVLKRELTFRTDILDKANDLFRSFIMDKNVTAVGIYIKKEDPFKTDAGLRNTLVGIYTRAMTCMQHVFGRVVYLVASDDVMWCKQLFPQLDNIIVMSVLEPSLQLAVLSKCSGSIVTGYTIGWWAAWLSKGHVVFNNVCYDEQSSNSLTEYYPSEWVPLTKCNVPK